MLARENKELKRYSSVLRIFSSSSYMGVHIFSEIFCLFVLPRIHQFFAEFLFLPRKYFFSTSESEPMSELCALLITLFVRPSLKFRKIHVFRQKQHLCSTERLHSFLTLVPFSGVSVKLRKATISFVRSVRPSD